MSEEPKRKAGCFPRLLSFLLLGSSVGLAAALWFASQPQDLSDLAGFGAKAEPPKRELKATLQSALSRNYDVRLTEAEINGWLKDRLELHQGGLLAEWVKLEEIGLRLEADRAEVIVLRSVFGKPFTTSMYLRIEQLQMPGGVSTNLHRDDGPFIESLPRFRKGGRFGRLVVPQGLLLLVVPEFSQLKKAFDPEIKLGFEEMSRVRIEDGALHLDPRIPGGENPNLLNTF